MKIRRTPCSHVSQPSIEDYVAIHDGAPPQRKHRELPQPVGESLNLLHFHARLLVSLHFLSSAIFPPLNFIPNINHLFFTNKKFKKTSPIVFAWGRKTRIRKYSEAISSDTGGGDDREENVTLMIF